MGLHGKRANVRDLKGIKPATMINYPSEGDHAIVKFDGRVDYDTVHKSRVKEILPSI